MTNTLQTPGVIRSNPNSNPFCGPAALSVILRRDVDDCLILIKKEVGDQPIQGLFYPCLLKILKEQGYSYKRVRTFDYTDGNLYLIVFYHHFGVLSNLGETNQPTQYFDNSHPNGTSLLPRMKIEVTFEIKKGN